MELPDSFPPADLSDLSELRPLAGWFGVLRALTGAGSEDHVAYALQANSIRLCQAAVLEHQLAVSAVQNFHEKRQELTALHWMIVSTNHFESCLWHLERFIKHCRALRGSASAEFDLKRIIPKTLKIFEQNAESRITRLRHRLAHLEKAAQNNELPQGDSIMLRPTRSGLILGDIQILWTELEAWLREAHFIVEKLVEFMPNKNEAP